MTTLFPTFIYRNKLLFKKYLRTNVPSVIDDNVEGDTFLYSYIVQLDEEIFTPMPLGLGELGEALWEADEWSTFMIKLANETRKHSWCMVKWLEEGNEPRWLIFTPSDFADWIREDKINEDGKSYIFRAGAKFNWSDDLGNTSIEELRFDDPFVYLFKYREGNGKADYAYADLNQAIMGAVFSIRQAVGQLEFVTAKPAFKWVSWATGADEDKVNQVRQDMKYIDLTSGIGAGEDVIANIKNIEDAETIKALPVSIDKLVEHFAGVTRLPVSYYVGKSVSSGLSDIGEKVALLKLQRKKTFLFNKYEKAIRDMFGQFYEIELTDKLEMEAEETLEVVEEEDGQED